MIFNENTRKAAKINKNQSLKNKKTDTMSLFADHKILINKDMLDVNIEFDFEDIDSDEELRLRYGD